MTQIFQLNSQNLSCQSKTSPFRNFFNLIQSEKLASFFHILIPLLRKKNNDEVKKNIKILKKITNFFDWI